MINKLLCFIRGHKYAVNAKLTALRNLLELNIFDKDQMKVEVCKRPAILLSTSAA